MRVFSSCLAFQQTGLPLRGLRFCLQNLLGLGRLKFFGSLIVTCRETQNVHLASVESLHAFLLLLVDGLLQKAAVSTNFETAKKRSSFFL